VVVPPAWAYFSWHFEDLYRIPSEGPAILACNHISYLDPVANAYAVVRAGRRPRFLAKDDLFSIPVVGRVIGGAKQIPVRRGTGDRLPRLRCRQAADGGVDGGDHRDRAGPLREVSRPVVRRQLGFRFVSERDPGFQTRAVHGAVAPPVDQATPSVPIYQTSTF